MADANALQPRVIKFSIVGAPAVLEPRTTVAATTHFAGFLDDAALRTHGTAQRCRDRCCWHVTNGQTHATRKTLPTPILSVDNHVSTDVNLGLTSAGLHARKPAVTQTSVADTSAVLVPSTTRSATTDSSGFTERPAFCACHTRRDNG